MLKNKKLKIVAALLLILLLPVSTRLAGGQAVVQSYSSDSQLTPGMIVEINVKDTAKVEPATQSTISRLHGVVVNANDSPVTLQGGGSTQQYYVATDGTYNVLVSDQNGQIQKGDYVTVSSIAGVGMKASSSDSVVLGKALNNFDGISGVQSTDNLVLPGGHKSSVHIGMVAIDITIAHNPLYQPLSLNSFENALQRFAQSSTHKQVNSFRLYAALAVLVLFVGIAGTLMITGIRSSLVAIGRNPLAKSNIIRGLAQVILTSLIVFLIGVFAVYLLLKL